MFCSIFAYSVPLLFISICMARGKQTCKILKEIRRQIAEANGIKFITSECRYKGDCRGTCPKCEAEVLWLESQLKTRAMAGKAVALAGISASLFMMSACGHKSAEGSHDIVADPVSYAADKRSEGVETSVHSGTISDISNENIEQSLILEEEYKTGEVAEMEEYSPSDENEFIDKYPVVGGVEDDPIFSYDELAEFPGGIPALQKFMSENIVYPEAAVNENIEGKVIVKFIVSASGKVEQAAVVKSVHPLLDDEAIRVVSKLPNFIPAKKDDKNVACFFTMPVNFNLGLADE